MSRPQVPASALAQYERTREAHAAYLVLWSWADWGSDGSTDVVVWAPRERKDGSPSRCLAHGVIDALGMRDSEASMRKVRRWLDALEASGLVTARDHGRCTLLAITSEAVA